MSCLCFVFSWLGLFRLPSYLSIHSCMCRIHNSLNKGIIAYARVRHSRQGASEVSAYRLKCQATIGCPDRSRDFDS
ncbi:hypothetical protein P168DRAFT_113620 [Aspergillus campestris IBT 28561]|uniref:Secreted protein n=1 Tax=Aspergillus campestris (strain IBT 28561) TaxID=1392248 RepID=A0A2I1D9G9_ASPC2|nr:uncharacterized protein P168DRAFT_113620 [Aspergillus campestris IBT 28561]PKY06524.1 hypothetical protein P168DRAFT_113620 [Aspergillus campestris IBT 28561]